jgi:hydroxyacylglutathione hydrolase
MEILENLFAFLWLNSSANNCNTFLINGTKKILVDPGHEHLFGHVRDELARLSLSLEDIDVVVITHGHPDHMEGVRSFADTPALTAVRVAERAFNIQTASRYGDAPAITHFEPDLLLRGGELNIGDMLFEVIEAPGHSPDSICLYWPDRKVLFSGDVVFNQGVGRTDLPGGNGEQLKESIRMLSELEVDYLLPGHGDPVIGRDRVKANFSEIERVWFAYL